MRPTILLQYTLKGLINIGYSLELKNERNDYPEKKAINLKTGLLQK